MTGWVWAGIFIGLAIVVFAVGVPYLITHKGMRSPDDPSNRAEADAYFHRKRAFSRRLRRLQRQKDAVSAEPGRVGSKQNTPGSQPRIGSD
jgi:hypothetical protein